MVWLSPGDTLLYQFGLISFYHLPVFRIYSRWHLKQVKDK